MDRLEMQAKAEGLGGKGDLYQFWGSRLYESVLDKSGTGKISPIKEGDVIDLGDRPLKIIDLPGHTPGSIAVLDVKNRVLISGDSVQDSNIYMFGPAEILQITLLALGIFVILRLILTSSFRLMALFLSRMAR